MKHFLSTIEKQISSLYLTALFVFRVRKHQIGNDFTKKRHTALVLNQKLILLYLRIITAQLKSIQNKLKIENIETCFIYSIIYFSQT